mmetsp:Transcript_32368/g.60931  ORF Transcript_32368/g.60931 Transcript_32368/m.60931 type:complete len:302 (+) Transcript_32368:46-951(+)
MALPSALRAAILDEENAALGEEANGVNLEINPSEPVPIETEDFVGRILFVHRPTPEPEDWSHKEMFRGKQRNFQFRFQVRFKTDPGQDLYLAAEVPRATPMEAFRKKAATLVMKFATKLTEMRGGNAYFNLDWQKFPDSDVLRPHTTIPIRAADYLVQTPAGEEPPSLMGVMDTMPSAPKKAVVFNATDTYTVAWWSKYVDLVSWKLMNMPMGMTGSLDPYIGREFHLSFFRLPLEEELKAMEADGLPPPNNWLCESQKLTFARLKITNFSEAVEPDFEDCVDWDELEEDVDALAEQAIKS